MERRHRRNLLPEPDSGIDSVHRYLAEQGVLAALELGGSDERAWMDCDLASLAENRLGEKIEPSELDDTRRADWRRRATSEQLWPPAAREFERCFWLLEDGERIGTVALATTTLGGTLARVSSFYLRPSRRGRGAARLALHRIRDALGAQGRGLRLETCWTWQRALSFYMRAGMWVRMWKRDIDLWCKAGVPPPLIDIGEASATISVEMESQRIVLVRAERSGERLVFADAFRHDQEKDERVSAVGWDASSTLAVALAMRGWPLLESPASWKRGWHGDAGDPEGLADRIVCWEAWDKKHGWRIETPRIPGLAYPTWEELEAEWEKDD